MKIRVTILTLFLSFSVYAQEQRRSNLTNAQEERVQRIIKNLDPQQDQLRQMLENGLRGDGIHMAWMDKMKSYGVSRAIFFLKYEWKEGRLKTRFKSVMYFSGYGSKNEIKDRKLLRQIRKDGLEQELRDYISEQLRETEERAKELERKGEIFYEVFDDEVLPGGVWIT